MAAAFVSSAPLVELQRVSISPGQLWQPCRSSTRIHGNRTETFHDLAHAIVVTGGCAAACYAATRKRQSHKMVRKAFENELGVQPPVGFFDPLGFTKSGDEVAYTRRRETEIKHGRVAMLAAMGYITPEYFRFPGYVGDEIGFSDIPNGLAALGKVPAGGWLQIFLFIGLMDTAWIPADEGRAPGDRARCGALGVPNGSSMPMGEARNQKLNAELANGRLAMMAIMGMFFQDGLTGSAWGDWSLYVDSPLRAFDPTMEVGTTDPFGYFDPLNLSKDEDGNWDESRFQLYRTAELKHGRVAMLAVLGFLIPPWFFVFPEFQSVPASLGTLGSNVDVGAGFGAVFLLASFFELKLLKQKEGSFPGDFGDPWGGASLSTRFDLSDQRNKELNNGRLAMLAVIWWSINEYYNHLSPADQVLDALNHPSDVVVQFGLVGVLGAWVPFINKPINEWPSERTLSPPKDD